MRRSLLICDRCEKDSDEFKKGETFATIGISQTCIDLCPRCYEDFQNKFMKEKK